MSGELSGCVIVSGMPGAGKSTVTALAARLLPRAAQVTGDTVNLMIVSGRVWFMGKPGDEARRQDELCNRNMCSLANNFVDFDTSVLTPTETAQQLVRAAAVRAVPVHGGWHTRLERLHDE